MPLIYTEIYTLKAFCWDPERHLDHGRRFSKPPFFMLNTRSLTNDPCETHHEFFLESVEKTRGNQVVTTYVRSSPRNVPPCSSNDNHSADHMSKIEVFSSSTTIKQVSLSISAIMSKVHHCCWTWLLILASYNLDSRSTEFCYSSLINQWKLRKI